jgi:hypothetical protein
MNAPPPFCAAWTGKRKKFPRPMALPATASIKPMRVPQLSRWVSIEEISAALAIGFRKLRNNMEKKAVCQEFEGQVVGALSSGKMGVQRQKCVDLFGEI